MNRDVKYGLILVATSAVIYSFLLVAMSYGRQYGINIYPSYIIPFSALAPLFYASRIGRGLIRDKKEPLSKRELITFGLISILGVAITSFVAEAGLIYGLVSQGQEITFSEVVFAPLNKRYSVTAIFGMSFAVSATVIIAFVALMRIPAVINVRLRLPKAKLQDE